MLDFILFLFLVSLIAGAMGGTMLLIGELFVYFIKSYFESDVVKEEVDDNG